MSGLLSDSDLTALRATAASSFDSTALIKRPTLTADAAGGYTETASPTASTVACRLAPMRTPVEQVLADRIAAVQGWQITLPALTDVRPGDRITVGSREFEVIGMLGAETYETARRAACVEIL